MSHHHKRTEINEDSVTSSEEEITESGSSVSVGKSKIFGIPLYKLSPKRLPKKCLKVSFLLINSGSLLAGIITVVLSIWMLVDIKLLIGQRLFVSILLLVGILVTINSFLGLLVFAKKRKKILFLFIMCQSIFLCIIFIFAMMSISFFDNVVQKIWFDMRSSIENYRILDKATEDWDNTQKYLQCCGIKSYKDWIEHRKSIPQSCCSTTIEKCVKMSEKTAYRSGCLKNAVILLKSNIHSVYTSAMLISIIIGASLFIAFGVLKKFKVY